MHKNVIFLHPLLNCGSLFTGLRAHWYVKVYLGIILIMYSKTCLKQTPTGPENLSALDRCPPYRGSVRFAWYDHFAGSVSMDTLQASSR